MRGNQTVGRKEERGGPDRRRWGKERKGGKNCPTSTSQKKKQKRDD